MLKFELIAGSECICREWHGCIMSQSIVGLENVQPYTFSECSKTDYIESLRSGNGFCLLNKPNEVRDQGDQVRKSSFYSRINPSNRVASSVESRFVFYSLRVLESQSCTRNPRFITVVVTIRFIPFNSRTKL